MDILQISGLGICIPWYWPYPRNHTIVITLMNFNYFDFPYLWNQFSPQLQNFLWLISCHNVSFGTQFSSNIAGPKIGDFCGHSFSCGKKKWKIKFQRKKQGHNMEKWRKIWSMSRDELCCDNHIRHYGYRCKKPVILFYRNFEKNVTVKLKWCKRNT